MSDLFIFGPESRLCPSRPITNVSGQQFILTSVLHNESVQFIDFSYLKSDDELIIRLSLNHAKLLINELQEVVSKSQKLNSVLIPISSTTSSTPAVSSIIERGLQDPNYKIANNNLNNINNEADWNQSPFREDKSPSEVLQQNQLPRLKRSQQAMFTKEHLELSIQALREPGIELVPSVFCPSEHLEELLLRGFDKRSNYHQRYL